MPSTAGKEKLVFNDSYGYDPVNDRKSVLKLLNFASARIVRQMPSRMIISVSVASSPLWILSKYHPPGYLQIF